MLRSFRLSAPDPVYEKIMWRVFTGVKASDKSYSQFQKYRVQWAMCMVEVMKRFADGVHVFGVFGVHRLGKHTVVVSKVSTFVAQLLPVSKRLVFISGSPFAFSCNPVPVHNVSLMSPRSRADHLDGPTTTIRLNCAPVQHTVGSQRWRHEPWFPCSNEEITAQKGKKKHEFAACLFFFTRRSLFRLF